VCIFIVKLLMTFDLSSVPGNQNIINLSKEEREKRKSINR
jgi:hypothetical protein